MTHLGRAISPGSLRRVGGLWVLDYRAGDGRRVREALSSDKRVAERIRSHKIAQRDLEMAGLGGVEGQSRPLQEVLDAFVADLDTRTTPRYRAYARQRIDIGGRHYGIALKFARSGSGDFLGYDLACDIHEQEQSKR